MPVVLLPDDVRPDGLDVTLLPIDFGGVGADVDLASVEFFIPPYLGPQSNLELIAEMTSLQAVQVLTVGYDAALPFIPDHVTLCNAVGVHDAATAEMALTLILASLRGVDDFVRAMPRGEWAHTRRESLADKRVVVIGAGGVGRAIAARLIPFEVDVTLVGRSARAGVHSFTSISGLLPTTDVVVVAVPLSPDTARLIDAEFLALMPDGSLLVNVARGGVVDTAALLDELAAGRLRAALDVTDPEPLPSDHPLWQAPGLIISPHVGGDSSAFLPRARRLVDGQLPRWAAGLPLEHVVVR